MLKITFRCSLNAALFAVLGAETEPSSFAGSPLSVRLLQQVARQCSCTSFTFDVCLLYASHWIYFKCSSTTLT